MDTRESFWRRFDEVPPGDWWPYEAEPEEPYDPGPDGQHFLTDESLDCIVRLVAADDDARRLFESMVYDARMRLNDRDDRECARELEKERRSRFYE